MNSKKKLLSRVSSKGQTTIPAPVRKLLHINPGDTVKFEIEDNSVRIQKAEGIDLEWALSLESTLNEWSGMEDDDL